VKERGIPHKKSQPEFYFYHLNSLLHEILKGLNSISGCYFLERQGLALIISFLWLMKEENLL